MITSLPFDNGGLAFAARTTSSFPGRLSAGQPGGHSLIGDRRRISTPFTRSDPFESTTSPTATTRRRRTSSTAACSTTSPSAGRSTTIIGRRAAETEVDRRLLYIEPDPGEVSVAAPDAPARAAPGTIEAAIGAASGVAAQGADSRRSARCGGAQRARRTHPRRHRDELRPRGVDPRGDARASRPASSQPDLQTLAAWNTAAHAKAVEQAGPAYSSYLRLKISMAADRYARTVCAVCDYPDDSNHALLRAACCSQLGCKAGPVRAEHRPPTEVQLAFLRRFDLGFVSPTHRLRQRGNALVVSRSS